MSAAKEARDRRHFIGQFEAEGRRTRIVPVDRYYLQRIEDDLAAACAETSRLGRDLDRCKARLRERASTLTVEREQWQEDRARWHEERYAILSRAHEAEHAMLSFRRKFEHVSRLLRHFHADQVRAAREAMDEDGDW